MTRASALALLLLALPAHAAGNAPGAHLWPPVQEYAVSVPMGELPSCTDLGDCCGIDRACCPGCDTSPLEPAPVPLPWPGLMLTAAIAAIIWKGMRR